MGSIIEIWYLLKKINQHRNRNSTTKSILQFHDKQIFRFRIIFICDGYRWDCIVYADKIDFYIYWDRSVSFTRSGVGICVSSVTKTYVGSESNVLGDGTCVDSKEIDSSRLRDTSQ
jgi:hypothetical protein